MSKKKITVEIEHYEVPYSVPSYVRNPPVETMTLAEYQAKRMAEDERKRTNPSIH